MLSIQKPLYPGTVVYFAAIYYWYWPERAKADSKRNDEKAHGLIKVMVQHNAWRADRQISYH